MNMIWYAIKSKELIAQSVGAVEYTNCFFVEGKIPQRVSWIWH